MLGIFLARGLGYTANSWATRKEGRPSATLVMARLRVRIEHPAGDLRKNEIPFILLHEFGHVLTAGAGCLPDWWAAPATLGPPERYPCLAPSWTIDALRNIVPADPAHHAVYNGLARAALRRADAEHALGLYQALQATAWPSLYAANYAYDDFAECFAPVPAHLGAGPPYSVAWVTEVGAERKLLDAGSVALRCADKFRFMARHFGASAWAAQRPALALSA